MFLCALGREAGIEKEELAWMLWVVTEVLGHVGHKGDGGRQSWESEQLSQRPLVF